MNRPENKMKDAKNRKRIKSYLELWNKQRKSLAPSPKVKNSAKIYNRKKIDSRKDKEKQKIQL